MAERNLDIFGTYLRGLTEDAGPRSGTEPLLGVLSAHPDPMRYRELWNAARLLGYTADEFTTAYRLLLSTGAVQVAATEAVQQAGPSDPTITLTPLGRAVAVVERGGAVVTPGFGEHVAVLLFGGFAAAAELLSRYRDAPFRAMTRLVGVFYLGVNAAAGVAALWAVQVLGLEFGLADPVQVRWARVLVAGFSAVALFRSSLFTVRVGDRDVPIGPAAALQQLLATLDREVDRHQAARRTAFLDVCRDLPTDARTLRFLAALCLGIMQNVGPAEQNQVKEQLEAVMRNAALRPADRRDLICLQLLAVVGFDALTRAVTRLIQHPSAVPGDPTDDPTAQPPPV